MLHNLLNVARKDRDGPRMLALPRRHHRHRPGHRRRALDAGHAPRQRRPAATALEDVNWLLDHKWDGIEREKMLEFRRLLEMPEK